MPIVAVCEAATRPPHHGSLQLPHVVHQRLTDASHVWNLRVFTHPDAVIDDATDVFGEVAVQFSGNLADGFVDQYFNQAVGGTCRSWRQIRGG